MNALSVERGHLSVAHGRTVAVSISTAGIERTFVGRGLYESDAELGHVLRIRFGADQDGELLLAEDVFDGDLLSGQSVGSDFLLRLN